MQCGELSNCGSDIRGACFPSPRQVLSPAATTLPPPSRTSHWRVPRLCAAPRRAASPSPLRAMAQYQLDPSMQRFALIASASIRVRLWAQCHECGHPSLVSTVTIDLCLEMCCGLVGCLDPTMVAARSTVLCRWFAVQVSLTHHHRAGGAASTIASRLPCTP